MFIDQAWSLWTGVAKDRSALEWPTSLLTDDEFRERTVAAGLEKLGQMVDQTGIESVALIYPPIHIRRIRENVTVQGVEDFGNNAKFDLYRSLYGWTGIMNIRDWRQTNQGWQKVNQIPIDFKPV